MFSLLLFDSKQRNVMVCCLKMVDSLLNILLENKDLNKMETRLNVLGVCYIMLKVFIRYKPYQIELYSY